MNLAFTKQVFMVGALLLSSQTFALEIKSIVAAGSGCKATEKIQANASASHFEIMVPQLKSDRAKGKKFFRSNCNLSVTLDGDTGKQFKVVAVRTNYETTGTNKDELSLNFKFWFQGESNTTSLDHKIDTSKGTEFRYELSLPIHEDNWSACKKENVFNASVSFIGKNQSGFSNEYSLSQPNGLKIELLWRPCH
jgi:hypothetical protein